MSALHSRCNRLDREKPSRDATGRTALAENADKSASRVIRFLPYVQGRRPRNRYIRTEKRDRVWKGLGRGTTSLGLSLRSKPMEYQTVTPSLTKQLIHDSTCRFACPSCSQAFPCSGIHISIEERIALYRRRLACKVCMSTAKVSFATHFTYLDDADDFKKILLRVCRALSVRKKASLTTACEAANVVLCIRDAIRMHATSGLAGFADWPEWQKFLWAEDRGSKRLARFHAAEKGVATKRTRVQMKEAAVRVDEIAITRRTTIEIQDELRKKYSDL